MISIKPVVMNNAVEYTDIRKSRVVTEDVFEIIIRDLTDAIARLLETTTQPYLTRHSAKALLAKVYLTRAGMSYGTANDFVQAKDLAKEVTDDFFVIPIPAGEILIDPLLLDEPIRFDFALYQ